MTETEKKALALVNEVRAEYPLVSSEVASNLALCRTIEQHEAFRQEVSDAVESRWMNILAMKCEDVFSRFIIAKPDPLEEVMEELVNYSRIIDAASIRAAIEARGGRIVWEGE